MSDLTQQEIYAAFDWSLKEVARRYAAGELDMSGRYWTDEELKAMERRKHVRVRLTLLPDKGVLAASAKMICGSVV